MLYDNRQTSGYRQWGGYAPNWAEINHRKRVREIKNALWVLVGVAVTLAVLGLVGGSEVRSLL